MSDSLKLPDRTWFLGCGNMGGAILEGWRSAGFDLSPVTVIRPSGTKIEGVRVVSSLREAGAPPKLAILGIKPQKLNDIAVELRSYLSASTIVVSLLAGVEVTTLRAIFPNVAGIVRATPNLPVCVRRGVTGLYGEIDDLRLKQQIGDLFVSLGYAMWMADEEKLAALGSVAGAGPAYVARFIAALSKAGLAQGLSAETSTTVALETVLGTAWMALSGTETMESLAKRVASPKGTTQAGLDILDRDGALDGLIDGTIRAASNRGRELAEDAKAGAAGEDLVIH